MLMRCVLPALLSIGLMAGILDAAPADAGAIGGGALSDLQAPASDRAESRQPAPPPAAAERRRRPEPGRTIPSGRGTTFEYRIGEYDLVSIEVFQVKELNHKARVNSRGYISFPLLGAIKLKGLTVEEAEQRIADKLREKYLQDPHVSIFIEEYESQKYTVEGQVKEPGVFPLKGPVTLLQAIAIAKGIAKLGDEEGIVVFRANEKGQTVGYVVDLDKVRSGEAEDPLIIDDDLIVVPTAGSKAFLESITGALRGFIGFSPL